MKVLCNVEPKEVFGYFEDICSIPHSSGNTYKISEYCVNFAKEHNLEYIKDVHNNVVIKKPASKGYEAHQTVIIQGHLDMVCEKDNDVEIDFDTDGLSIQVQGDYISAKGTTLGGDDGIAVAMALAVLADDSLEHPTIEALFTTDEETGMYGAQGLDATVLCGKMLINIDSEAEGVFTVGCAGGARVDIKTSLDKQVPVGEFKRVTITGLIGGHSGIEIDKGRLNSNILMGQFLSEIDKEYYIADINGGLKDNAIPRTTQCILSTKADLFGLAKRFVANNKTSDEPDLDIVIEDAAGQTECFDVNSSKKIADILCALPNGVQAMSEDIEGLVETSLNLGVMSIKENKLGLSFSVRSSKGESKIALLKKLENIAVNFDSAYIVSGDYPAWEYKENSRLRDTMIELYEEMYSKKPTVDIIHAGLECGLFSEKIEGLDAVSIGPDMFDIHTSRERLSISSAKRVYEYLCNLLRRL